MPETPGEKQPDVFQRMRARGADPFLIRWAKVGEREPLRVICRTEHCPGGCAVAWAADEPDMLVCLRHEPAQ